MIDSQQRIILKAISKTTPFHLSDCIDVFLCVVSYDDTIVILNQCSRVGVPISKYLESYKHTIKTHLFTKEESLLTQLINWMMKLKAKKLRNQLLKEVQGKASSKEVKRLKKEIELKEKK